MLSQHHSARVSHFPGIRVQIAISFWDKAGDIYQVKYDFLQVACALANTAAVISA
jgi:flavoprotein